MHAHGVPGQWREGDALPAGPRPGWPAWAGNASPGEVGAAVRLRVDHQHDGAQGLVERVHKINLRDVVGGLPHLIPEGGIRGVCQDGARLDVVGVLREEVSGAITRHGPDRINALDVLDYHRLQGARGAVDAVGKPEPALFVHAGGPAARAEVRPRHDHEVVEAPAGPQRPAELLRGDVLQGVHAAVHHGLQVPQRLHLAAGPLQGREQRRARVGLIVVLLGEQGPLQLHALAPSHPALTV
mmetsp:Transcript_42086/g.113509  ORF Transcript_42086/g.113509 Transcript_42086/m.113509 type:complete len:241 (-) Transcript_42086:131-853(-)